MRISIILAHPNQKSFNHAIADTVRESLINNGHEIYFHDLYREKFDPILLTEEIPKDCIFGLCGINNFFRKTYGVVVVSSEDQRKKWLNDVKKIINQYFSK